MLCNSTAIITICNQLINNAFLDLSWIVRPIRASIPGRQAASRGRALGEVVRGLAPGPTRDGPMTSTSSALHKASRLIGLDIGLGYDVAAIEVAVCC